MAAAKTAPLEAPLVVRTHVTPWGFVVALPLALLFAALGGQALDTPLPISQIAILAEPPAWLHGALLMGLAVTLFLVGIAELASYLSPSVAVIIDATGVTAYGVLGARHLAWHDVRGVDLHPGQVTLLVRRRGQASPRDMRLLFNRFGIEPAAIVEHIHAHRPDLSAHH